MSVWDHCLRNENLPTDLKSLVIGVKTQMEPFDFFVGLTLGHRLYAHTDNLSRTLQTQKMSACNSQRNAGLTISVLEKMRYNCPISQFYDTTQMKAKSHHFVKDPIIPCKRKAPNYSIYSLLMTIQVRHQLTILTHAETDTELLITKLSI